MPIVERIKGIHLHLLVLGEGDYTEHPVVLAMYQDGEGCKNWLGEESVWVRDSQNFHERTAQQYSSLIGVGYYVLYFLNRIIRQEQAISCKFYCNSSVLEFEYFLFLCLCCRKSKRTCK